MIYHFDVFTALHDEVKTGQLDTVRSRVVVEADTYPTAQDTAAALAVAVHGGMATAALVRF